MSILDIDGLSVVQKPVLSLLYESFPNNESDEIEYKSAQGGFPKELWNTYVAFANTNGGVIMLGISEKKNTLRVDGLSAEQIQKLKKDFWDGANNLTTVNKNLLNNEDLKVINVNEKKVLAINVPIAKRTDKPIHLTRNPFENTYKRNHEGDYKCTKEEVRRMISDADTSLHHDNKILENFTIEDINLPTLRKYRNLFSSSKPDHPWLQLDDIELLRQLGGYRKDHTTNMEGFTLAGILMFGKGNSILDPSCTPNFFPDYREILSEDESIRWTDRIFPDGTWEANLFEFYLKVWPMVSSRIPKPFIIENGLRKDETPTHVALRESLINFMIHADHSATGGLVVEMRKEKFKLTNPGTLLVSIFQYYQGGTSECRNPNLQKMFLMIGGAEKAGSGVSKIISGWEFAHWRRPYIKIYTQPDRVELILPLSSTIPDETLGELKEIFGEDVLTIGNNELTILSTCQLEGEVTNARLQHLIDKHKVDITLQLQDLCKRNFLVAENTGRWTTYHLNQHYLKVLQGEVPKLESTSKRTTKEDLNKLILNYCAEEFKTTKEISEYSNRSETYLRNKVINKLIASELLIRRFSDSASHPEQAYKSKK